MIDADTLSQASARVARIVRKTPVLSSPFLDEIAGRKVFVKAECLQHTGSFKYRGATNAVRSLSAEALARGVIAFSSGNHAQGVARAAAEAGAPAVIIMPKDAPKLKIDNTRSMGAEVVLYDRDTEDRMAIGTRIAKERGLSLIPPFDFEPTIAGQATCGVEFAEQLSALGVAQADVTVCCGGGGLTAGVALAFERDAPGLRVRPCEPEGFDDVARSLVSGQIEQNPRASGSICDAIITASPGTMTFPIMQRLCGPGVVVSDQECLNAMREAFMRLKLVAEPGGAAALAAALYHAEAFEGDAIGVLITGGNVDPEMFVRALSG